MEHIAGVKGRIPSGNGVRLTPPRFTAKEPLALALRHVLESRLVVLHHKRMMPQLCILHVPLAGATLRNDKGIDLPENTLRLSALTAKDLGDLAVECGFRTPGRSPSSGLTAAIETAILAGFAVVDRRCECAGVAARGDSGEQEEEAEAGKEEATEARETEAEA